MHNANHFGQEHKPQWQIHMPTWGLRVIFHPLFKALTLQEMA